MVRRSLHAVIAVAISVLALILSPLSAPASAVEEVTPALDVSVVVESDDGRFVLEGIELTLFEWVEATEGAGEWAATSAELDPTDGEGLATFQIAEAGDYMLGFVDPNGEFEPGFGLGETTRPAGPGAPGTFGFDGVAGEPVSLEVALVTIVDPEIEDAEVVGLVKDAAGEPIPYVKVEALAMATTEQEGAGPEQRSVPGTPAEGEYVAYTDYTNDFSQNGNHEPRGGYRLILPPGEYRILFTREDDETSYFYGEDVPETITVGAGRHYELEDTELPDAPDFPATSLTGQFVDAGGTGLAFRYVDLYRVRNDQNFDYVSGGFTDEDGLVTMAEVPIGRPLVACAYTRMSQQVCADGRRGLFEALESSFMIPPESDGFVAESPLVVDPTVDVTVPLVGLKGQPIDPENDYYFLRERDGSTAASGWSISEGSITFAATFPGDYSVCTYLGQGPACSGADEGAAVPESDAAYFEVPAGSTTFEAPAFRLPYAGFFTSTVRDASGDPVPGQQVYSIVRDEEDSRRYLTFDHAQTRPDGSFSVYFGEPGDYFLCLGLTGRQALECRGSDSENYFGVPETVTPDDEVVALDEFRVLDPVVVEGRVVDGDGLAVAYPYVELRGKPQVGNSHSPYLGYASGEQDGTFSTLVFPSDEQITFCSNRSGANGCLGGSNSPEEEGTQFVTLDGSQSPFQLEPIVLEYSNNVQDCQPGTFFNGSGIGRVLDNGTAAMGFGCYGNSVAYEEGFDSEGHDWVGFRLADGDPETRDVDAIAQGCYCEGWGVGDVASGISGFVSANHGYNNVRLAGFTAQDGGLEATSTVNVGWYEEQNGVFDVTHEALPSTSSNAHLVRVTIQNVSDVTRLVRYRRTIDWDVAPTTFNEIVTSSDGDAPEVAFMSNDGFASPNPLSRRDSRGATGNFRFGPKDQGSLLELDLGGLAAGEKRVFTLALGASETEDEAQEALDGLGAVAYSMATASDPSDDKSFFIAYGVGDAGASRLPSAAADEVTVSNGASVEIDVLANDSANTEDGSLVIEGFTGGQHGIVMCTATSCSYEHDGSDVSSDSFRYTIRNSAGLTASGRVDVAIQEAPPSAVLDELPVVTPSSDLTEGDVLEVTPATYTDERGTLTRTYDWYLNFGSSPYLFWSGSDTEVELPSWAAGATVTVTETAKAAGFKPVSSTSEPTAAVASVPELYATAYPEFVTTPMQDETASLQGATWASWDGSKEQVVEPDAISYRWYVGGDLIASDDDRLSDDGAEFTPTAADVGKWIQVELLATKEGFLPGYAYAYASRIKGEDDRSRVVRVNVTRPDGVDGGTEDDAVTEASVWMCSDGGGCYSASLRNGAFELDVPSSQNGIEYDLSVYPYAGDLLGKSAAVSVQNDDAAQQVTVKLEGIAPPPPSISFPDTSPTRDQGEETIPMGFIGSPLTPFTATGCTPEETPTWTLTFANGSAPMTGGVASTVVNEQDPEKVDYTIEIPDLTSSGHATITTNFECDGPISFTIYIDPSGYVTDQFGRTIAGAEVTLLRDLGGANFAPVADGDLSVMDPNVNDANPSLTDETGFFRWDVAEGDYRVSVTSATSGGRECAVVTTPTMSVPPERVDLVVKTECEGASTPTPTSPPRVSNTPLEVGRVLSVSTGTWSDGIVQTGVQWLRNGDPIEGATGSQYTLTEADADFTVTARVTAQRPNYVQENGSGALVSFTPFTSPAVGGGAVTVANPGNPGGGGGGGGGGTPTTITNTAKPSISGTAKVGGQLAADPGTWSTEGLTFAYQWTRDGAPIAGATGATYAPVVADLDKAVRVTVTASRTGLTSGTATSDPVTVGKGAAPANTGAKPLVTGTPEVGETLTVSDGTWDLEELTFAYQWLRDGEPIEAATAATYVVTTDDQGSELTARVTASKAGHEDGSVLASGLSVPEEEEPVDPAASTTKATLRAGKVTKGERGIVRVKVTSEGESVPTGTITVTAGRKSVEVTLTESDQGKVKVTLPKLKPGKYEVSVSYSGDEATEGSADEAGTLKVKEEKKGKKGKGKKADRTGGGRPMAAFL